MGLPLIIGAGLGIISAFSAYSQGQAQAAALREQAALDEERADKFLKRTEMNILSRRKQVGKAIGSQQVALADAGIELGTGVSLDMMEDAYFSLVEEEEIVRMEAEDQAFSIRQGADNNRSKAGDVSTAGTINAITSLLGTGMRMSNTLPGSKTKKAKIK